MYRDTTARIKLKVDEGAFEDDTRMQEMDVRFANLYIKAYHDYHTLNQIVVIPTLQAWLRCHNPNSHWATVTLYADINL